MTDSPHPMMRLPMLMLAAAAVTLSCARPNHALAPKTAKLPPPQAVFERQVRNAIDAGDGDYQVHALRQKLAAEPGNVEARLALAKAYQRNGFPDVALEHYRLAVERFPESAEARMCLAGALRGMGQRTEAARTLETFLAAHPAATSKPLSWLGILRDELGQWTEGEKAHRAALALSPGSDYLHNNLGYSLLVQGRREEAAREFEEALRINSASALARNNLGLALANKADQALQEWRKVNDAASAHNNLAAAFIEQGRYGDARTELDIALGYNRTHPAALNNLRLVSQLDGSPVELRGWASPTCRWVRWRSTVLNLFVGPLPDQQKPSEGNGKGL